MQLKNSFRQLIRTPAKTALFIVFIACVTAFLCFGINMQLSVKRSLEQADASFTTIGVAEEIVEAMGGGIGSSSFAYWDTESDYSTITSSPHVLQFDQRQYFSGYCPDLLIGNEAYRRGNDTSILIFEALSPDRAKVLELLYDRENYSLGDEIRLTSSSDEDFVFETGKQYIASISYGNISRVEEASSEDFLEIAGEEAWKAQITELKNSVHTFGVYGTNDLQSMLAFHQGNAVLAEGRFFTQQEYLNGERVCLINAATLDNNDLEIGDHISLDLYIANSKWTNLGHDVDNFDPSADTIDSGSFESIGTYMELDNMGPDYGIPEQIFIPQNSIHQQPNIISSHNFVSFRLRNGSAEAFMTEIEEHFPEMQVSPAGNVSITIYDQGYSKISGALDSMQNTALLLTVVGAGAGLVLIVLLGNLFVGRQLRTIAVMYSLGVSRQKCLAFLMLGIILLVGTAALLGAITGSVLSNSVMTDIYAQSLETAEIDLAYSDIYGGQQDVAYDLILPQPWLAPLLAILMVLIGSLA